MSGLPNWRRSCTYATVRSRAAWRDGEAHRGVAETLDREDLEQLAEPAWTDDEVLVGHAYVIEDHVGRGDAAKAHQLFLRTEAHARAFLLDDERADAFGAGVVAEPGVDEVEVGLAAVGDPALGAVERPGAVGLLGPSGHVGRGRTRVGLGDGDGHGDVAADDAGQQALLLLVRTYQTDDLRRTGVGLEHLESRGTALLGELLLDDESGEQRGSGTAVLLGQRDAEPAELAQVASLLDRHPRPVRVPLCCEWGIALAGHGRRDLPDLGVVIVGAVACHHGCPTFPLRANHDIRRHG